MSHNDRLIDHAVDVLDDIAKHSNPADRDHLSRAFVEMPAGEALRIIGSMTGNSQLENIGKTIRNDGIDEAVKGHADPKFYYDTAQFWTHFV